MEFLVFDTETTGLSGRDEVVQMAGLLLSTDLRLKKVINFYCYTQVPFNRRASEVNKLSAKEVRLRSNGKFFEDYYCSLDIFRKTDLVWIGYNTGFDTSAINNTLENNGMPRHYFGKDITNLNVGSGIYQFDVLQMLSAMNGGVRMRLTDVAKELDYTKEQLDSMYSKLLRMINLDTGIKEHNALYDVMITWLLVVRNRRVWNGLCTGQKEN